MASFLSRLFGSSAGAGSESGSAGSFDSEDYNGYTITPAPQSSGGQFNTAGVISKAFGEEVKEHRFIRADTHASADEAAKHSLTKAKQIIDEQGDMIFG